MTSRLLFVSLTSLAIVASCSPIRETTNNKNVIEQEEIIKNQSISWFDALNQKENNYIIFVYSETCGYCHDMMDEIIDFAKSEILVTYFINSQIYKVPISNEIKENIADINQLSILGTPTIIEIDNKIVVNNIAGIDKCLNFLIDKRMS